MDMAQTDWTTPRMDPRHQPTRMVMGGFGKAELHRMCHKRSLGSLVGKWATDPNIHQLYLLVFQGVFIATGYPPVNKNTYTPKIPQALLVSAEAKKMWKASKSKVPKTTWDGEHYTLEPIGLQLGVTSQ